MTKLSRVFRGVLLAGVICGASARSLTALDIPMFIEFRTSNEILHYPARIDRAVNWDDSYQVRFGIDSLTMADFYTKLTLKSTDNFVEQQVLLEHAELVYTVHRHRFGISSRVNGYGLSYRSNNVYHNDPRFAQPLYKAFRFNGFDYRNGTAQNNLQLSLGAMDFDSGLVSAGANKYFSGSGLSVQTGFKSELRIKDSFHSRPLALYSTGFILRHPLLEVRSDLVLAHYPRYKSDDSVVNLFETAELTLHPVPETAVYLSNLFESRTVYPLKTRQYTAGLVYSPGRISMNPEYELKQLDADMVQRFNLILAWRLHRDIKLAAYFRHADIRNSESVNVYGIQALLHRDF